MTNTCENSFDNLIIIPDYYTLSLFTVSHIYIIHYTIHIRYNLAHRFAHIFVNNRWDGWGLGVKIISNKKINSMNQMRHYCDDFFPLFFLL